MRLSLPLLCGLLCSAPGLLPAQRYAAYSIAETSAVPVSAAMLPNAPVPNGVQQESRSSTGQPAGPETQQQTGADQARQKAREQIREQEGQRVLGILPAFNTSYRNDAVSLTPREKMGLAFRSAVDPVAFGTALLVAGWGETFNSEGVRGFGWGPEGFAKRAGAKYLDSFNGTMLGNGVLPSILHQDPRYFRLGHGSVTKRTLYAVATSFVCKHDHTGRWEPNYSNIGGNLAAGAISNLYYPDSNSGWSTTIENGAVVTAVGSLGAIFQEFWPDISRKVFHKDPTRGLDAQAAPAAEKQQANSHQK